MRLFVSIVMFLITFIMFSGCATKTVTNIAEDGKTLFYIDQISNAYFKPNTDEILIDTNIRYSKHAKQERTCFNFSVDTQWEYQKVFLTEETLIACPDSEILANYQEIPILKRGESDSNSSMRWRVTLSGGTIYIAYSDDTKVMLKKEMTVYPVLYKGAYLLYPISIPFDIITFPVQLLIFVANVADGIGGFPVWPGFEDEYKW